MVVWCSVYSNAISLVQCNAELEGFVVCILESGGALCLEDTAHQATKLYCRRRGTRLCPILLKTVYGIPFKHQVGFLESVVEAKTTMNLMFIVICIW